MKQKVNFGKATIEYSVIKSKRRKTSQITVDKDNVIVRAPVTKPNLIIKNIVKGKAKWIYQKQLEFKKNQSSLIAAEFTDSTTVPLFGKNCLLQVKTEQEKTSVSFKKSTVIVSLQSKKPLKKSIKQAYEKWLISKASKYLQIRIKKLTEMTDFKPSKIIIKDLKGRWGSTTREGTINLNYHLIKAPKQVIDYVIVHELCHLKIRDHSFRYWNLVRKFMYDYTDMIIWLEKNNIIQSGKLD